MTKKQLLEKLQSSEELVKIAYVPVSEVINWVNQLESGGITEDQMSDLISGITDGLMNCGTDLFDDYTLEMNYREVELVDVDLDTTRIERTIKSAIVDILGQEGN